MAARRRALMLAPESPFPTMGGGPLRTASIVSYLSARYDLDVIVFREPDAPDPRTLFPPGLVREIFVIELPHHSKEVMARAARNLRRYLRGAPPLVDRFSSFDDAIRAVVTGRQYELGIIEHFWCARYLEVLRPSCARIVLDLHNIESVLLGRSAQAEGWPASHMLQRFSRACARMEHQWLRRFDLLLVTSDIDKVQAVQAAPLVPICVYPNAIPTVPLPKVEKRNELVFSGNLEYLPNQSALRFFGEKIWPAVRERWPELKWRILGRNHAKVLEQFRDDNRIVVTGPVEDAVTELASSRVAIVPMLAGSGTRIKIIEAWAAGLPVVSTPLGAEGLPGVQGEHLLLATSPEDFGRAISSLFEFPALQDRLGAHGRRLYEDKLTWEAVWKQLERCGL